MVIRGIGTLVLFSAEDAAAVSSGPGDKVLMFTPPMGEGTPADISVMRETTEQPGSA